MSDKQVKLGVTLGLIGIIVFLFFFAIRWVTIEGNEASIWQNLFDGVTDEVSLSGTHFYFGILDTPYVYNIGTQKCTFADQSTNPKAEYPRIMVNLGEKGGQTAWISMSINYRIGWEISNDGTPRFSPKKLVTLHKDGLRKTYQDIIIKRTILDVVNLKARPKQALDIYAGIGFVNFKEEVTKELKNHPVFAQRGIYLENVIVTNVDLRPEYEKEIAAKKLAEQTYLRKVEETRAAEQEARRAFAESQAMVEREKQQAEAAKIRKIKAAEAEARKEVLQAEAEKQKRILEAEGDRDAKIAQAKGVEALGKAQAQVEELKKKAMYDGEAGERRALVEVAKAKAQLIKGMLEGVNVVPEDTVMFLGKEATGTTLNLNKE